MTTYPEHLDLMLLLGTGPESFRVEWSDIATRGVDHSYAIIYCWAY